MRKLGLSGLLAGALASLDAAQQSPAPPAAQPARPTVTDGIVRTVPFDLPFSEFASEEARAEFIELHRGAATSPLAKMRGMNVVQQRKLLNQHYFVPRIAKARARYPVNIQPWTVGGVYTEIVTPKEGVAAKNAERVLINLHGGGFTTGARTNGQLESIPIAGVGKYRIVTIDYRQGPENRFPAASEDVTTVYRELLKAYKPEKIGIFGCSAGGSLTAQAIAWFQKEKLPRPGAIGIFCASAGRVGEGDSHYLASIANGQSPPSRGERMPETGYFRGADASDPLVSPVNDPSVLAKFPPTLLITATRDMASSGTFYTQRKLVNAGVETDLHVWDGLAHYFFANVDLPESQEAYGVISRFFDKHLGE